MIVSMSRTASVPKATSIEKSIADLNSRFFHTRCGADVLGRGLVVAFDVGLDDAHYS